MNVPCSKDEFLFIFQIAPNNRLIIKGNLGLAGTLTPFILMVASLLLYFFTSCERLFYYQQKWRELNVAEGLCGYSRDPEM